MAFADLQDGMDNLNPNPSPSPSPSPNANPNPNPNLQDDMDNAEQFVKFAVAQASSARP